MTGAVPGEAETMEDVVLGLIIISFFVVCGFAVNHAGRYMNKHRGNTCGHSCADQYTGLISKSSAAQLRKAVKRSRKAFGPDALMVLMVFTVKGFEQEADIRPKQDETVLFRSSSEE